MNTHTYLVDSDTGVISNEIRQGDSLKITRKETKDFLKETEVINDKETFIKLYTKILKDLTKEHLTGAEYDVILCCLEHLNYYSGAIVHSNNGNFLTPQDIEKYTELNRRTITRSINKLVTVKILHKGKTGKDYQLYANPFIFMKGSRINKTLTAMFRNSKWAKTYEYKT